MKIVTPILLAIKMHGGEEQGGNTAQLRQKKTKQHIKVFEVVPDSFI